MATVTRENIGALNDKLTIRIAKEEYLPAVEKSLKDYAKKANIPGFRKGMVPAGLVKKMYGSSVFNEEIMRTVEKELTNYVTAEKLDILAQPLPLANDTQRLDISNPADYTFDFEIGYKPEINIDLQNIKVTRYKVNVTDEMINAEVDRQQMRNGKMTDAEVIDNDENVLNVTFAEADENGTEIENGIKKDNSLLLKYFTETAKAELRGKKVNDSVLIQPAKAFEQKEREFVMEDLTLDKNSDADAEKYFLLTIKKIGLIEKAELNEEFYNVVYPGRNIASEEDLKAEIKKELENYFDSMSNNQLHDQIFHSLTDTTQVEFPDNFLKRWLLLTNEDKKSEEQVEQEFPTYKSQLKWSLIGSKLIQDYNVTVSPEELKMFAQQRLLNQMGGQNFGDLSWMEEYTNRVMKDRKFVEQAHNEIQSAKLFDALASQVQATEEPISAEDFAGKQHHHH